MRVVMFPLVEKKSEEVAPLWMVMFPPKKASPFTPRSEEEPGDVVAIPKAPFPSKLNIVAEVARPSRAIGPAPFWKIWTVEVEELALIERRLYAT